MPLWSVVGSVLAQVQQQKKDLVLIAIWKGQPWYPADVQGLSTDFTRQSEPLLANTSTVDARVALQLALWSISGGSTKSKNFKRKLQTSCSHHGGSTLQKTYESQFQKWISWCGAKSVNPISCPVGEVVNFLANLFDQGYQYRSLSPYRSAISLVHEKVDGQYVG